MTKRPTPEKFVKTWNASATVFEVAEKLKMNYAAVEQRAKIYRGKGVELKSMRRVVDVEKLNRIGGKK